MNANPGRCPLCGGAKRPGVTTFAVDLKFGVVVVRDVPALVCETCGDAWIDDPVAERLKQSSTTHEASRRWSRSRTGGRRRREDTGMAACRPRHFEPQRRAISFSAA